LLTVQLKTPKFSSETTKINLTKERWET